MRNTLAWMIVVFAASAAAAAGQDDSPIAPCSHASQTKRMLTAREHREYLRSSDYKKRINVYRNAFTRISGALEVQARQRQHEELGQSLDALAELADLAFREPSRERHPKHWRSSQVRKLEIQVRKLVQLLEDMSFSFPMELRDNFVVAESNLKRLREQLLEGLFGSPPKKDRDLSWLSLPLDRAFAGPAYFMAFPPEPAASSALPSISQGRRAVRPRDDRFTEEELEKLRYFQDLNKRVDVFLKIAESRLDEIHRRMTGSEYASPDEKKKKKKSKKDEEESNPLEFFTYWDMVRAYERAIDGITVNIDDKHKFVEEGKLKKVMKKLNKQVQKYIPRLEPVKQLALDRKDEELYKAVGKAVEISEIALKGSQMFLGTPEK